MIKMVCDKEQLTGCEASIVFSQQEIIDLGLSVIPCRMLVRSKVEAPFQHYSPQQNSLK